MTRSPKTITVDQRLAIFKALDSNHFTRRQRLRAVRNVTMFLLMYETGLRVGEICKLIVSDLYFAGEPVETLIVREEVAKNGVEREIPCSQLVRSMLSQVFITYWSAFKARPDSFAFFASDPSKPLSTRTVERFIRSAALKAINKRVTPHMLRHSFATNVLRKSNTRVVQMLLGHKSEQTTQVYTHPDLDDLRRAIE